MITVSFLLFLSAACLFVSAVIAHRKALLQEAEKRLPVGKGGIYQRVNELRWHKTANTRVWLAAVVALAGLIVYVLR